MLQLAWQYLPQLLQGMWLTVLLVSSSLCVGLIISLLLSMLKVSLPKWLCFPIDAYVFFIRGTPLLVQIFLIYFGSSQIDFIRHSFLWEIFKQPLACAIIALAINTSAYTTELVLGAIASVPRNEKEAAQAYGMSHGLMFRRIVWPRALRFVLPAYSNEVIMVLKGSSLASTITLLDLMGMTRQIVAETYATMEFFIIAGILYLLLNSLVMLVFRWLERRLYIPQSTQ